MGPKAHEAIAFASILRKNGNQMLLDTCSRRKGKQVTGCGSHWDITFCYLCGPRESREELKKGDMTLR